MRAVRFHTFGDPAVLRVDDVAQPAPHDTDVLIRATAASVNRADLGARQGHGGPIHVRRLPMIPGYDLAGEVAACGRKVTAFLPGDRVFALVGLQAGTTAEYVAVSQAKVARAPQHIPLVEAAAVPLAGLTALQGLRRMARLQSGQRVLIIGAAGGVGSFAVQLAKVLQCHVTAVCRAAKAERVASLGADEVIDSAGDAFLHRHQTWHVVLDASGRHEYAAVRRVLTSGGVMVGTRASTRSLLAGTRTALGAGPRFRFFITRADGHDLQFLAHLIDQGKLRPLIDRIFPMEEIQDAHRRAESGEVCGKVVVRIRDV